MSGAVLTPERIGRFRIRSVLGRGAMGIVYLGHDEAIDRLVAIKLIRADLLDTEEREGYLKRFRNEARIAGRCMHANIVGLYDFATHDENPYLVMEYVDGTGLQQFFPRGSKRPVQEVIHIALQVLDALHYTHARSIVHRDIKPANILMMPDLSLKITDFGISRLTSTELTVMPLLIGTPSYMSPEQCTGLPLDGRNDLFSLGCVLYELVAGERAFAGANYTETIFSIVNKPHLPLSQLVSDLPPGFGEAIDKALAKSPDQRHSDAASFARILDDISRTVRPPRNGVPPAIRGQAVVPQSQRRHPFASDQMSETTFMRPHDQVRPIAPDRRSEAGGAPPAAETDHAIRHLDSAPARPGTEPPADPDGSANHATADEGPGIAAPSAVAAAPGAPAVQDNPPARPGPIGETERSRIVESLAAVIGPIAPLLLRRAEQPGMTAETLAGILAGHLKRDHERRVFLGLLARRGIVPPTGNDAARD